MEKERKYPCSSGLSFNCYCLYPVEGETPKMLKDKITRCIIETFDTVKEIRGETCLYVSKLAKDLLYLNGIISYIVGGEARWNDYPHFYKWEPQAARPEFHVWCITQYGEICDLACDSFESRYDANTSLGPVLGIKSPVICWEKAPKDREYIPYDCGCKNIQFDKDGYEKLKEIGSEVYSSIAPK